MAIASTTIAVAAVRAANAGIGAGGGAADGCASAEDRILADGPRGAAELYVALTRATQRLGVLHHRPLPTVLTGLGTMLTDRERVSRG